MNNFQRILFEVINKFIRNRLDSPISSNEKTAMKSIEELLSQVSGKSYDHEYRAIYNVKTRKFHMIFSFDGTHSDIQVDTNSGDDSVAFIVNTKRRDVEIRDDEGFLTDISFKKKQEMWKKDIKKYFRGFKIIGGFLRYTHLGKL